MVDARLSVCDRRAAVGADAHAGAAADAVFRLDDRLALPMLLHLAGTRAAAHAEVFQRAAEARLLVALEVGQRDHDVGVHDGLADLGLLDEGQIDRDEGLVRALESVGDDDVAAGLQRREAVEIGRVHVVERVLAAADVERVAVGQEGQTAERADVVGHDAGVLRAQVGEVAQLAEVDLDGGVAVGEVDLLEAGALHQTVQLLRQRLAAGDVEIGEVYGRFVHGDLSLGSVGSIVARPREKGKDRKRREMRSDLRRPFLVPRSAREVASSKPTNAKKAAAPAGRLLFWS